MEKEMRLIKKEETETYTSLEYCGGNNGRADWQSYFKAMSELTASLITEYGKQINEVVVNKFTVDVADDIFYVEFYIYK